MELNAIPDYQDLLEQIFLVPTRCVGIQTQRAALCTAGADSLHSHAARGNESKMGFSYE